MIVKDSLIRYSPATIQNQRVCISHNGGEVLCLPCTQGWGS